MDRVEVWRNEDLDKSRFLREKSTLTSEINYNSRFLKELTRYKFRKKKTFEPADALSDEEKKELLNKKSLMFEPDGWFQANKFNDYFEPNTGDLLPGKSVHLRDSNPNLTGDLFPPNSMRHRLRTPCTAFQKFSNGASCKGGMKYALQLMKDEAEKLIKGEIPCVEVITEATKKMRSARGFESCKSVPFPAGFDPMDTTSKRAKQISRLKLKCSKIGNNEEVCSKAPECIFDKTKPGGGLCEADSSKFNVAFPVDKVHKDRGSEAKGAAQDVGEEQKQIEEKMRGGVKFL